ncbi:MAG: 3-hydroxylacyl-ACP dehydratase [Bacteroidales bacterium]|jgi:3-hydroxyacyl-[acyl-carrier-protein] dehydratase|nr:3-hydroxylacyl-ACP dehydratase [Bacteroidales bacterium]
MKLQDDFFKITDVQTGDNSANYRLKLNADHPVYAAHFPGNPITPGVCIIQMVKELAESYCQQKFFLKKVANVKFMNVINPLEYEKINVELTLANEAGQRKIAATVSEGEVTFSKLSLTLTEV